jgi:hypothetical protein
MITIVYKLCTVHGKIMHSSLRSSMAVNYYGVFPVSIQYFNDTVPITQVAEMEIISVRTITQLVGNHRGGVIEYPRLMQAFRFSQRWL